MTDEPKQVLEVPSGYVNRDVQNTLRKSIAKELGIRENWQDSSQGDIYIALQTEGWATSSVIKSVVLLLRNYHTHTETRRSHKVKGHRISLDILRKKVAELQKLSEESKRQWVQNKIDSVKYIARVEAQKEAINPRNVHWTFSRHGDFATVSAVFKTITVEQARKLGDFLEELFKGE